MSTLDTQFLEDLASADPAPGGGGAAAYCAAVASALASMVGSLTLGKARYAHVQSEVTGSLGRLSVLRSRLVDLVDADAEAFLPLAAAYRMPRDTDRLAQEREDAIQAGLMEASQPPLQMIGALIDVLHECDFLAHNGSSMAISDAGACAALAKGAILAASLNVYINADSLADEETKAALRAKTDALVAEGCAMADGIYGFVAATIDAYREG